jgi:5-oxoprolinase (ATP-hydrolysing)
VRPFGAAGGEAGELGKTLVRRADGRVEELKGCDQTVLEPGEAVTVITPTGGGYGTPEGGSEAARARKVEEPA